MFDQLARIIISLGTILIFIGGIIWLVGKFPFVGRLPGDILIKKDSFTFYVPLSTAIIISLILSLVLTLIANFKK